MSDFVVEDNIPIAKKAVARQRSPLREALAGLQVGQCVTVFPDEGQSMKALRARLSGLTQGAKQDNPEAYFLHRTVDARDPNEGDDAPVRKAIRIWRVTEDQADPSKTGRGKAKGKAAAQEPPPRGQETGAEVPDPEDPDDPFGGELDEEEEGYEEEYEEEEEADEMEPARMPNL